MSLRTTALAFSFVALALPVYAAGEAPATPAEAPAAASMPMDCGKMMARHDHGAEKGTPTPGMDMKCPMGTQAAAATERATPKSKAKKGHDHAKFHKLM